MAITIGDALLKLGIDKGNFDKDMKSIGDQIKQHQKAIAIGMVAMGAAIAGGLAMALKAAAEEEAGISRLRIAMGNVGLSYDKSGESLEKWINAQQQSTAFADDKQRDSLSNLVVLTKDLNKSQGLLNTAMDVARWKKVDLATASDLLMKVYAGDMGMLKRYGIIVKEGATAVEALAEIQQKAGGQAEAYGKTMAGQMELLKNNLGDVSEAIGGVLIPIVKSLFDKIMPIIESIKKWTGAHPALTKVIVLVTGVLGALLIAFGTYILIAPKLAIAARLIGAAMHTALGPIGLVTLAISALITVFLLMANSQDKATEAAKKHKAAMLEQNAEYQKAKALVSVFDDRINALNDRLQELQSEQSNATRNSAGFKDELEELNEELETHKTDLEKAETELGKIQESFTLAEKAVAGFEQQIADANRELTKLTSPRLEGMQEFENQIFDIDQQINKLRLEKLLIGGDTPALDEQIDKLEKQRDILQLQSEIKFDPMIRSAREAVETIQGMNVETAPQTVMDRIAELGMMISPEGILGRGLSSAQAALLEQNQSLIDQTANVKDLTTEVNAYQTSIDDLNKTIASSIKSIAQSIIAAENAIYIAEQERATRMQELEAIEEGRIKTGPFHITPAPPQEPYGIEGGTYDPETMTGWANGGIISEPTLLSSMKTGLPYAIAGESGRERVSPMSSPQTANIIVMLDGRTIGKAIGQPLVDEIRVRTGVRI